MRNANPVDRLDVPSLARRTRPWPLFYPRGSPLRLALPPAQSVPATVPRRVPQCGLGLSPALPVRLLDRPTTLPKGRCARPLRPRTLPRSSFATTGILGGAGPYAQPESAARSSPHPLADVQYTNPRSTHLSAFPPRRWRWRPPSGRLSTALGDPHHRRGSVALFEPRRWGYLAASPTFSLNIRQEGNAPASRFRSVPAAGEHALQLAALDGGRLRASTHASA